MGLLGLGSGSGLRAHPLAQWHFLFRLAVGSFFFLLFSSDFASFCFPVGRNWVCLSSQARVLSYCFAINFFPKYLVCLEMVNPRSRLPLSPFWKFAPLILSLPFSSLLLVKLSGFSHLSLRSSKSSCCGLADLGNHSPVLRYSIFPTLARFTATVPPTTLIHLQRCEATFLDWREGAIV